jgi:hypothetical protein
MTRSSPRGRSTARASGSSSSQQYVLIGGIGVAVLVLVFVLAGGGTSQPAQAAGAPARTKAAPAPAAAEAPPAPAAPGKGRTPDKPAPPLSDETLAQLGRTCELARTLYNQSVTARAEGDVAAARSAAGEAAKVLEQWKALVRPNLAWQEDAQMGSWSQPAEYLRLERLYQQQAELTNKVRRAMGGG